MFRALVDRVQGVQRITDPVFGALKSRRHGAPSEGAVAFAATGSTVELILDASTTGPTSAQRTYLVEFSDRYEALLPGLRKLLPGDAAGYELVCIDFQSQDPFSGDVELTYERASDLDLQSVRVTNWQFQLVTPAWSAA